MTRFSRSKNPIPLKDLAGERNLFRSRIFTAAILVVSCFLLLLFRYAHLQIQQYDHFTTESDKNRIKLQAVPPTRGYIYDRNGILLADNHPIFTAMVNLDDISDLDATLKALTPVLDLSQEDLDRFTSRARVSGKLNPIALKIDLTEPQIARFSERKQEFPGVSIQTKMTRFYPHGDLFAHVIGYVGRINDKEQATLDKVAYAGTDLIGKIGIERSYEDLLHGTPGYQYIEANAHGEVLRQLGKTDAKRGNDLYLSIDYGLQKIAQDQLAGRRGAVVAMDPRTGEVLAFVSNPSFDPNPFIAGIKSDLYAQLRDSPDQPLFNRALQGLYPPGSTIKPFEGLGGIHFGLIDWSSRIFDGGSFHLPGDSHLFRDDAKRGHGIVDLDKAIAVSCDTFFYVLAYRMGIDRMHEWMTQFGFGSKTGIDLPGEKSGLYPSQEWKRERRKSNWLPGETISLGIGQGYFLASPLQLAMATSIMANQGNHVRPHLLLTTKGPINYPINNKPDGKINFNGVAEDWLHMRDAMVGVVMHGTARRISYGLSYQIAGKTGTAQVVSIAQGKKYNESALNHRQYDHALFTAFAPADAPRIAVAIIVENGKHGASAAAPIARAMFDYAVLHMDKDPIKPEPAPVDSGLMTAGQPMQQVVAPASTPKPQPIVDSAGDE
ncbi:penicillin-binding protein 2 [Aquirhabdus parva]|uniref:Peptidoglycan D,D-transpeptidase MrdA n=1 Tax=Aquirhabdus parva TaxID=2283318 RepID=A0A345P7B2_9GAMM|nr:penicillin-binding protein 2 [Aquirhabdus parva]AXI03171.1 penicillin-binding protein 2 [Aquirhabdus parva]